MSPHKELPQKHTTTPPKAAEPSLMLNGAHVPLKAFLNEGSASAEIKLARVWQHLGMAAAEPPQGIALALNGAVVPRSTWDEVVLGANDEIEILGAVAGG